MFCPSIGQTNRELIFDSASGPGQFRVGGTLSGILGDIDGEKLNRESLLSRISVRPLSTKKRGKIGEAPLKGCLERKPKNIDIPSANSSRPGSHIHISHQKKKHPNMKRGRIARTPTSIVLSSLRAI